MQLGTCGSFEELGGKGILQIIKYHAESFHHIEFSHEKSFRKAIVALDILYKWSVLWQLYWNKSTSTETRMDERITHTVYLSNSVLLQPPGTKMNVPYVISRRKRGWWIHRCVSRLKKTKATEKNWNIAGSNQMNWKGLCFGWQSEMGGLYFGALLVRVK